MSIAFLIVRIILGLGLAAHGTQKLFGWFGGGGIAGTATFFEKVGFRPGVTFALLAGLGETLGGVLTLLGLGGALGPVLIVTVMLVAIVTVHIGNGYFAANNGWELPATVIAASLAVAFAGPGAYSLDAALGLGFLYDPLQVWYALAAALVAAALTVLARRPLPSAQR